LTPDTGKAALWIVFGLVKEELDLWRPILPIYPRQFRAVRIGGRAFGNRSGAAIPHGGCRNGTLFTWRMWRIKWPVPPNLAYKGDQRCHCRR